ncbi:hypothetical protein TNIN_185351 [Trichonephila inaurata madagascariensis]|uniref:Uncharacterized protein n=1 Tax=Trichonephila inaurata madagascariensis TaxID=2747483 RepID=A0A8X7BV34_9ARAC|nr:hypothetical protein TNIN_185351 [Trichonephila inaurata madagascariensis]
MQVEEFDKGTKNGDRSNKQTEFPICYNDELLHAISSSVYKTLPSANMNEEYLGDIESGGHRHECTDPTAI